MATLPSTCTSHGYKDSAGKIQVVFSDDCYYPGSNCILSNDQCISVFKETGCRGGDQQYQCSQAYYLKQQTQTHTQAPATINTSSNNENAELKAQLQDMQKQIETLTSKQTTQTATTVPPAQPTPFLETPAVPYALLGIVVIGIVVLMKMKIITFTKL